MLRDTCLIPLSRQHHSALVLCVLCSRALAADRSAHSVRAQARQAAAHFELEMKDHFEAEEQVLFPAVEEALGALPLIAELLEEHQRIAALAATLEEEADPGRLEEFVSLVRHHIRREEAEFFEHVQNVLPREILDRLGVQLTERAAVCAAG